MQTLHLSRGKWCAKSRNERRQRHLHGSASSALGLCCILLASRFRAALCEAAAAVSYAAGPNLKFRMAVQAMGPHTAPLGMVGGDVM